MLQFSSQLCTCTETCPELTFFQIFDQFCNSSSSSVQQPTKLSDVRNVRVSAAKIKTGHVLNKKGFFISSSRSSDTICTNIWQRIFKAKQPVATLFWNVQPDTFNLTMSQYLSHNNFFIDDCHCVYFLDIKTKMIWLFFLSLLVWLGLAI